MECPMLTGPLAMKKNNHTQGQLLQASVKWSGCQKSDNLCEFALKRNLESFKENSAEKVV